MEPPSVVVTSPAGKRARKGGRSVEDSPYWSYFDRILSAAGKLTAGKCKIVGCDRTTPVPCTQGNTTGLKKHLQNDHPAAYFEVHPPVMPGDQRTISRSIQHYPKLDPAAALSNLVRFVVCTGVPLNVIENRQFIQMMHAWNPHADFIPTRKTLRAAIIRAHALKKLQVMALLEEAEHLHFTTDCWTSPAGQPFHTVTAHWTSREWENKAAVLGFCYAPPPHTGENLRAAFLQVIDQEWHLLHKMHSVTLDNASANVAMMNALRRPDGSLVLHNRCAAHIIHLAVRVLVDAEAIDALLGKLRELIRWFRVSTSRMLELEQQCRTDGVKFLKPNLDCKTRWSSVYMMLDTIMFQSRMAQPEQPSEDPVQASQGRDRPLSMDDSMEAVMRRHRKRGQSPVLEKCPWGEEWRRLRMLWRVLRAFTAATSRLEAHRYPTACQVIPTFHGLVKTLEWLQQQEEGAIWWPALEDGKGKLQQYYCLLKREMLFATVLDPSKNIAWFRRNPITIFKEEVDNLRSRLHEEVEQLLPQGPAPVSLSQESPLEDEVDRMLAEAVGEIDAGEVEQNEVDGYFAMPPGGCQSGQHLQWWKTNEGRFPKLARVARKYAGMPATSAPSERIFSQGRHLINDFRHRLRPDLLNALLTLKSWYELVPADPQVPSGEAPGVTEDVPCRYNGQEEEEDGYVLDESCGG